MQFIKKNLLGMIIIFLIVIIFLQRCGGCNNGNTSITIKRDTITTTIQVHDTFNTKPLLIKTEPVTIESIKHDTIFAPSSNYDTLLKQYNNIAIDYLCTNIFKDEININDSNAVGKISILDTIARNKLTGRNIVFDLKYPLKTITNTITIPLKQKTQVYIGFGILGNKQSFINGIEAGIMLKTKTDKIYDLGAKYWNGEIIYNVGYKWKL